MKLFYSLLALSFLLVFSCKKQSSNPNNNEENELLTTVKLNFMDTLTHDTLRFVWRQPQGAGTVISVDTILLKPLTYYLVQTEVWDESKTPALSYTEEIRSYGNEHRFFYSSSSSALEMKILDKDSQTPPMELGLSWSLKYLSSNAYQGDLQVKLRHYTTASPKVNGEQAGSTDIEVIFPLKFR